MKLGRPNTAYIFFLVVALLLSYLVLSPIGTLLFGSLWSSNPGEGGFLTVRNYVEAFSSRETFPLIINSLLFSLSSAAVTVVLATYMAWAVTRTNTPIRGIIEWLSIMPEFVPPLLKTIAWIFLLSPGIGLINKYVMELMSLQTPPLNINSLGGMIWIASLTNFPLAFLIITAAFRSIDVSLEEAARLSGAGSIKTLIRVTLPIMRPAILAAFLLAFVLTIENIEIALLVGIPARIDLFPTAIYDSISATIPPNFRKAASLSSILMLFTLTGVFFYRRATRSAGRFMTITGKSSSKGPASLGRWRYASLATCILIALVSAVLPLSMLVVASFVKSIGIYESFTFANYQRVFGMPVMAKAMVNSFTLAFLGATLAMLFASTLSYMAVRTRSRFRVIVDGLGVMPIALPGFVLAIGLLWAYVGSPLPIYGTIAILLVAYITRWFPIGMRSTASSLMQIHMELEEASKTSGATWFVTFRRIILPLLKPGWFAGWVFLFLIFTREFSSSLMLATYGNEVNSVFIYGLWSIGAWEAVAAFSVLLLALNAGIVLVARRVIEVSPRF